MKVSALIIILCLIDIALLAQNGLSQLGARAAGMGYAYATESDAWALFNNPGGLAYIQETSVLFAFENKYSIEGLNSLAAGAITNLSIGSLGIGVFRYGDNLYNEQTLSVGYGNTFGIASLGIKANYIQYTLEGFGDRGIVTLDLGGVATITDQLLFGAYIRNINQAKVSDLEDERAATLLNAGLSYRPIESLHINIEAEKDLDYDASLRVGIEYRIIKKLFIRTGIDTVPFTNFAGIGFKSGKLAIDYALTNDRNLGISNQASFIYKLKISQ